MPVWDRRPPNGTVKAKLDVATVDHHTGRHIYVDCAVTCAHSADSQVAEIRSDQQGTKPIFFPNRSEGLATKKRMERMQT